MRTQGTHCPFIFIVKIPKERLSSNCKKVSKINLRIISKPHAHVQSMVKTSVKFQKNRNKTVGGSCAHKVPLSIHFHCQNVRKNDVQMQVQIAKKVSKINLRIISKSIYKVYGGGRGGGGGGLRKEHQSNEQCRHFPFFFFFLFFFLPFYLD